MRCFCRPRLERCVAVHGNRNPHHRAALWRRCDGCHGCAFRFQPRISSKRQRRLPLMDFTRRSRPRLSPGEVGTSRRSTARQPLDGFIEVAQQLLEGLGLGGASGDGGHLGPNSLPSSASWTTTLSFMVGSSWVARSGAARQRGRMVSALVVRTSSWCAFPGALMSNITSFMNHPNPRTLPSHVPRPHPGPKSPRAPSRRRSARRRPRSSPPNEHAERRFWEFFTAHIRNPNTRLAYLAAVRRFATWCERRGLALDQVEPMVVAAYIEQLTGALAPATVKQHLAALADALRLARGRPGRAVQPPRAPCVARSTSSRPARPRC